MCCPINYCHFSEGGVKRQSTKPGSRHTAVFYGASNSCSLFSIAFISLCAAYLYRDEPQNP